MALLTSAESENATTATTALPIELGIIGDRGQQTERKTGGFRNPDSARSYYENLTPEERELIKVEYYKAYDHTTGIRTAAALGGIIALFGLFLLYKAKCRAGHRVKHTPVQQELSIPPSVILAPEDSDEEFGKDKEEFSDQKSLVNSFRRTSNANAVSYNHVPAFLTSASTSSAKGHEIRSVISRPSALSSPGVPTTATSNYGRGSLQHTIFHSPDHNHNNNYGDYSPTEGEAQWTTLSDGTPSTSFLQTKGRTSVFSPVVREIRVHRCSDAFLQLPTCEQRSLQQAQDQFPRGHGLMVGAINIQVTTPTPNISPCGSIPALSGHDADGAVGENTVAVAPLLSPPCCDSSGLFDSVPSSRRSSQTSSDILYIDCSDSENVPSLAAAAIITNVSVQMNEMTTLDSSRFRHPTQSCSTCDFSETKC